MTTTSTFLHTSLDTSTENMQFDDMLLEKVKQDSSKRYFRFYTWKNPGITYSYNKTIPDDLLSIDKSKRVTGGGVVFHSPGDIVFSITARLDDPYFPKRFKDKICFVSKKLSSIIQDAAGINLGQSEEESENNILFCNSYPNPYEKYYKSQKVLAFAQRRLRDTFIVQGLIHTQSTHDYFGSHATYSKYFTKGLQQTLDLSIFSQAL
ncbi:hypothetical protein DID80_07265 [Candidatus Marinamargulisbacteria bacterium SCGC AAA071-K20]|nr:hypothetical protein DID80_07265 [Candidatus Marinamargulisbacteria bacterium SCGC AAA071-K20]